MATEWKCSLVLLLCKRKEKINRTKKNKKKRLALHVLCPQRLRLINAMWGLTHGTWILVVSFYIAQSFIFFTTNKMSRFPGNLILKRI